MAMARDVRIDETTKYLEGEGFDAMLAACNGQNLFLDSNVVFVFSGVRPIGESAVIIERSGRSTPRNSQQRTVADTRCMLSRFLVPLKRALEPGRLVLDFRECDARCHCPKGYTSRPARQENCARAQSKTGTAGAKKSPVASGGSCPNRARLSRGDERARGQRLTTGLLADTSTNASMRPPERGNPAHTTGARQKAT